MMFLREILCCLMRLWWMVNYLILVVMILSRMRKVLLIWFCLILIWLCLCLRIFLFGLIWWKWGRGKRGGLDGRGRGRRLFLRLKLILVIGLLILLLRWCMFLVRWVSYWLRWWGLLRILWGSRLLRLWVCVYLMFFLFELIIVLVL